MKFQRRANRKHISIRDVFSWLSLKGILIALILGIAMVAGAQLVLPSENVSIPTLMFCMTSFASIATWGVAHRLITSHVASKESPRCAQEHARFVSIARSGHARIRVVTSSVAGQINNSLMSMMSSLELIERRQSDFAHKKECVSLRRGMKDIEKIAQRLLKMSVSKGKQAGNHENLVAVTQDCLSEINVNTQHSCEMQLHFESDHLFVNVRQSVLKNLILNALDIHALTANKDEKVHVHVWQDSCLNSNRQVIDVVVFQVSSFGENDLVIGPEFEEAAARFSAIEWKSERLNRSRVLKILFPAVQKYSTRLTELPPQPLRNSKVLLVEDNPLVRKIVGQMIGPMNYTVQEAGSLKEGLEYVEEQGDRIDFAVVDCMLTDGSGLILVESIRMQYPNTPVVLITGSRSLEIPGFLQCDPCFAVLEKPFMPEEFENIIHGLLNTSEQCILNS